MASKMMHSTMELQYVGMEPKRSLNGFPISHSQHINSHHHNGNNSNGNNSNNNSPPAATAADKKFLLAAPRPLRRCRSASPVPQRQQPLQQNGGTVGHHQLLSLEQQALIRKSWLKIPKTSFGSNVFEKMLESSPGIERLFNPADPFAIARHERYFTEMTQWAVDGMAEPEKMLGSWLEMMGRGHGQFRVKRAHWDYMGEALTEAVCQSATISRQQRRETVHAWRILLSFLADRLGSATPATPDSFNRIHLLQLVANGPRLHQQQTTEEKEQPHQRTP